MPLKTGRTVRTQLKCRSFDSLRSLRMTHVCDRSFDSSPLRVGSLRMTSGSKIGSQRFLSAEVVFVVAFVQRDDGAVLHFKHARRQSIDEVAVVRNKNHRAGERRNRFQQHILGPHIQVVGRLVQQQKIRRRHQNPRQRKAVPLSARKHAQRLEHIVAGKEKAAQQRAQLDFRHLQRGAADVIQHARLGIEHLVLVLRKVLAHHVVAQLDHAGWSASPLRSAA